MKADEAKRLKELEGENARLKKLVADCPWTSRCSCRSPEKVVSAGHR